MARPRLPRTLTIRTRLLLAFVCAVAFTTAAISIVTAVIQSREARDRVVGQLKSVATLKEQQIDVWTRGLTLNLDIVVSGEGTRDDLRTLVVAAPGSDSYRTAYERVLRRFTWMEDRGLFAELFFMERKGQVVASTDKGHEGQQLGMNDYFVRGMARSFVQEPSYSLSLDKMTVVASAPVRLGGTTLGVLAGRAGLESLNEVMIGRAGLGQTGETYLIGSNHRLLTALRRPGHSIPNTYVRTAGADAAVDAAQSGFATYQGYAGDRVIGVYRWIPRLNVALLAEQGEGEALHATRMALWTTGGIALAATVIAILTGIVLIHGIVRPLSELGDTADRIAGGELELVARVRREDEIGRLAHAFNRMTARLRGLVHSLEKRSDHLRAINDAGRQISSSLELDELLPHVASSLLRTFDYDCVRILLLTEGDCGRLLSCSRDSDEQTCTVELAALDELPALRAVVDSGEPLLRTAGEDGQAEDGQAEDGPSEVAVPIRVGDTLAGVLSISAGGSHTLDEQDVSTATTLADQLAVAVENSRLYANARELAASRERARLARDLHDAVSQTLFSVTLLAEVLPRIYEKDPDEGRRRLDELHQLTRGALAEMRMLLLELRPASLAEIPLPDLLRQLTEAVVGRARIPIDLRIESATEVPPDAGVALYRIAQEALNNVAKHSGADRALVSLSDRRDGDQAILEMVIRDEGCGFDVAGAGAGRLGLSIMAERAESIGARLTIDSAPGVGTTVRAVWRP